MSFSYIDSILCIKSQPVSFRAIVNERLNQSSSLEIHDCGCNDLAAEMVHGDVFLHVCSMITIMSTWIHWHPFSSCDQMSQAIHSKRASHPEPLLEATSCHHWLSCWNFHLCRSNWWGCLKNRLPSTIIGLSSGSLAFPVWFPVWNVRLYYFMGYNGILLFIRQNPILCCPLNPVIGSQLQPHLWNDHPICN